MTQEDWEQRQRWVWSVLLLRLGSEGFSCISSHLAQQEERKHHRGFGWLLRFAQAAAPGHCCWWGNFTTEVCVLSSRDGSLTTRNSSSHCVSCFLNSLRMKSLWHCFLRLRFPTESQNTAVPIFWHCQGAYLHVDSMSTEVYVQAPQHSLGFASGKRQPTLGLHEQKENQF